MTKYAVLLGFPRHPFISPINPGSPCFRNLENAELYFPVRTPAQTKMDTTQLLQSEFRPDTNSTGH